MFKRVQGEWIRFSRLKRKGGERARRRTCLRASSLIGLSVKPQSHFSREDPSDLDGPTLITTPTNTHPHEHARTYTHTHILNYGTVPALSPHGRNMYQKIKLPLKP